MICSAAAFVALPRFIVSIFTSDLAVIGIGVGLLRIAAVFQLFDGLQAVAIGILRGTGDTRTAMFVAFFGYWVVGLPLAWWLCFPLGFGVDGLWGGLTAGLVVAAILLVLAWIRRSRGLSLLQVAG